MLNSTSEIKYVAFQRHPGICRGEETLIGSRIRRRFIKFLREKYGLFWVLYNYPHLTKEQIEAC